MNPRKEDNLDRLLRAWADAAQRDESHLETLRGQIAEAADRLEESGTEAIGIPKVARSASRSSRLVWFALGAAAAIFATVLVLSGWGPRQPADLPPSQLAGVPSEVRLSSQQLGAQARLLVAMKEVFADRLAWIAEADGKVVLGIEPEEPVSAGPAETITVRVVVMARRRGETAWHHRWSVDCIVPDEQFVELATRNGSENRLALWAHVLPDGMIAVDTSLGLDPSHGERSSISRVQRPRVPQRILDFGTDENEYRVFQTVAVLPKEVG